jgi:manganese/zinc/iron transport system permease protein
MNSLIPPFDFHHVMVAPWSEQFGSTIWIVLMGFLVTAACGLVGSYLILRRMALVGDAISHSVLPGIAVAFLLSSSRGTIPMFLGALAAGLVTTVIIEVIHKKTRVKQDAAIGIAFTSLFAIGVILISLYASKVDLDQECVLYGEIGFVAPPFQSEVILGGINFGPEPVVRMAVVTLIVVALILVFYKELLVSSFDPALAFSVGINATVVHYGLMCVLSVVVVSAFESVGAILVVAMLILPAATGSLLRQRLPGVMWVAVLHAAVSSVLGLHLATWLKCSIAAAMVVMGTVLFTMAWLFSPSQGMAGRLFKTRSDEGPPIEAGLTPTGQ